MKSELITLPRRKFIAGLVSLVAAPAIVRSESLMRIAAPKWTHEQLIEAALDNITRDMIATNSWLEALTKAYEDAVLYGVGSVARVDGLPEMRISYYPTTEFRGLAPLT